MSQPEKKTRSMLCMACGKHGIAELLYYDQNTGVHYYSDGWQANPYPKNQFIAYIGCSKECMTKAAAKIKKQDQTTSGIIKDSLRESNKILAEGEK